MSHGLETGGLDIPLGRDCDAVFLDNLCHVGPVDPVRAAVSADVFTKGGVDWWNQHIKIGVTGG